MLGALEALGCIDVSPAKMTQGEWQVHLLRITKLLWACALGVVASCGGGSGSPSGGTPTGAASRGDIYVQYAVMSVMGDSTSGLQPYEGGAEVDYDSAANPDFQLGRCDQIYDSTGSTNDVADTTSIGCNVSAPAAQGNPDAGGTLARGSSVSLKILIKGKPSPGLEITLASPSLVKVYLQLFEAHGRVANFPAENSGGILSDFSLKIDSVTTLPSVVASLPFTRFILDAETHATMADPVDAPGTASVSMTMSSPMNGLPDGGGVVGTCSDLTVCCIDITDATAGATCSQLEARYQGIVGAGGTQMQADLACATFLQLERKGLLCP